MASFNIGHAARIELDDVVAMGHKSNGSGNGLLIDKRLHALRDLREDVLIHARSFGVGLSHGRRQGRANDNE